jgi:PBSX family phage terminase large subunit
MDVPKGFPHKFQQMALDETARYILCIAGAQGGKTLLGALWLLLVIQQNANAGVYGDYLICAPTVKILNQSTMVKFLQLFPKDWGEWKEQKQCFELNEAFGNGKIFVRSADDPNHLEGMTLRGAWLDEFGQMVNQVWVNIQARLGALRGRCIMTTTPYLGYFWVKDQVYNKALRLNAAPTKCEDPDPELAVVEWNTADNPGFPPEELARQRKILSTEVYQLRYEGKFTRPHGLVYKDFDPATDVVKPFPIPAHWRRFGGLDFGFGSITTVVGVVEKPEVRDKDKRVVTPPEYYIFREFYKKGALLHEVAAAIENMGLRYTLGDPRGAQEIAELQRAHGVKGVSRANNEVEMGIERIKTLFIEKRLKVFANCRNVIEELQTYHYKLDQDDKANDGKPVKSHDHAMDGLKYAFSRNMEGIYKEKPTSIKYQMHKRFPTQVRRSMTHNAADRFTGYF